LEVFNQFGEETKIQHVPAILLLDSAQQAWKAEANTGAHRLVLQMPITVRQLREAIYQLLPQESGTPTKTPES
jgi:hypothetical protein